jgi:ribosomal protein L29
MIKDLKNKNEAQLKDLLNEKREALRVFRFKASGSKTKNVKEARNLRRDIARILTVIKANS